MPIGIKAEYFREIVYLAFLTISGKQIYLKRIVHELKFVWFLKIPSYKSNQL